MRLFIAIRIRSRVPAAERAPLGAAVRAAYAALDRVQPWPSENTTEDLRWVPGGGRVAMLFRSNETPPIPERVGWIGNKARTWAWSGIVGSALHEQLRATTAESLAPEAAWSAIGSFGLVGGTPHSLVAYTNQHRSEALYWTMLDDAVVISNSAAALSLMRHGDAPSYSRLGIAGFLMHALPFSDTLPFSDVHVVPAASRLASNDSSDLVFAHDTVEATAAGGEIDETATQIARGLTDYAQVLSAGSGNVAAAITGGKDSRLVVSALHAAGVDFSTYTNGMPESGEGVIGKQVTSALGVPHKLQVPPLRRTKAGGTVVVGKPEEQAWTTLRSTGGMGSAFTALPNPLMGHVSSRDRTNFGGQGGEIIRGGFARALKSDSPTPERARAILRATWFNNHDILSPLAAEAVDADTRDLFAPMATDPAGALFEGYVTHRTGRWLATMRHGESVVNSHTTLLINNQMVRELRSLPSSALLGERMANAVMGKLAPQVVDLPFFRDRWAFEANGADPAYKPDTWDDRAPYTAHDQPRADFNWRAARTPVLSRFFLDYILSSPDSMLFDVVDRTAVEQMLGGRRYRAPLAWALFSVQYMLSNQWLGDRPSSVESLEIVVP